MCQGRSPSREVLRGACTKEAVTAKAKSHGGPGMSDLPEPWTSARQAEFSVEQLTPKSGTCYRQQSCKGEVS